MQAVKAISGGVIALKGQLIKGSGYLVSTKGKMLSSTGDAITSLGRNIAKNAARPPEPPYHGHPYDHPPGSGKLSITSLRIILPRCVCCLQNFTRRGGDFNFILINFKKSHISFTVLNLPPKERFL